VTEPILYRHFASKQALYLACIEAAWQRVRAAWGEAVAAEPDPHAWTRAMAEAFFDFKEQRSTVAQLWLQALTESGDDPEIRRYLRRHLRDVHGFVAEVMSRCQAAGAIPADRDPRAEAWIFVAVGLLTAVAGRLGGLPANDLERIRAARRAWLTGS
jgi:AcrR family transcriptional regulator